MAKSLGRNIFFSSLFLVLQVVLAWMPDTGVTFNHNNSVPTVQFLGNATAKDVFRLLDKDDTSILIGARNVIYNLSLDDLKENNHSRIEWPSMEPHRELCILKGKSPEVDCQNYLRVSARTAGGILVCGTNSYKPYCRHYHSRNADGRFDEFEEFDCTGYCSPDPEHNSTAVYADDQLYSATTADFAGSDSLIYRGRQRTEHSDLSQLNNPSFVSSFRYKEFVFFFFRETAVEFMNCGKAVYSRVARVCVNDKGGPRHLQDRFTSYLKARLNCSFQGEYPFYFDEIQSTSQIISGVYGSDRSPNDIIYGVLTTPLNSIRGSAVCAFAMRDILNVFNGQFKSQESINSNWLPVDEEKVPKKRPGKCVDDSSTLSDEAINFARTHSLMEDAVPTFLSKPLLVRVSLHYRFTAIAVYPQVTAVDGLKYDVLYVGTDDGKVIKTFNADSNMGDFDFNMEEEGRSPVKTVVISEVQILSPGTPIKQLHVAVNKDKLIAISDEIISSMSLNHCSSVTSCSACVAMQDPHCAYDSARSKCIWLGNRKHTENSSKLFQDIQSGNISICPKAALRQNSHDERTNKVYGNLDGISIIPAKPEINNENEEDNNLYITGNNLDDERDIKEKHTTDRYEIGRAVDLTYTAQALHIAVAASCLVTLLLGFVVGYLFSRRFRHPFFSETTPFHGHGHNHLNRLTPLETPLNANSTTYLPPRANKTINLVVNVPVKQDNLQHELGSKDRTHECKNSNESLDKDIKCGTLQKVKKTYI